MFSVIAAPTGMSYRSGLAPGVVAQQTVGRPRAHPHADQEARRPDSEGIGSDCDLSERQRKGKKTTT